MRTFVSAISVSMLFLLTACPPNPANFAFTSADIDGGGFNRFGLEGDGVATPAQDDEAEGGGEEPRTVVEPDVIRRDGNLLYVLNQFRGLTIVDLTTDEILSRVPTFGFPRDLYLVEDRAYILVGYAQDIEILDGNIAAMDVTSRLHVVDVSDPNAADVEASFDIEGDLVDSRLVGDVLYAVTNEYMYYGFDDGFGFPEGEAVDAVRKQNSSSYVTSVRLGDSDNIEVADELQFSGAGHIIHVSPSNVFVATPDYSLDQTNIAVVDITDPNGSLGLLGTATAPGYIADRFKLDAWNGTLRVVSRVFRNQSEVYVTTIDLGTLDTLNNFRLDDASGDSLFATRFDGPLAYIVTYFVVDPLFVVDLSDPVNPTVRAPLEVPGYSIHIEPRGDRLIAMGVDDTDGQNNVAVSLFDVSGDPVRLDNVSFGENWSWSNAFNDVKAFTVLDDTIIIPFSGYSGESGGFERLQFISYTDNNLELRDAVDLNGTILRSFGYDDAYYGVTTEQLARIDGDSLDDLDVVSSVTLAENVVDFVELGDGLGAEIIAHYDEGTTEVRIVDEAMTARSSVAVDIGNYGGAFNHNGRAVVYGTGYDYETDYRGFYQVAVVGPNGENEATVVGETTVDIEPYYGNYGYYYFGGPEVDFAFASDAFFAPPYPYDADESAFLIGDTLLLRGYAEDVNRTVGGGNATQVLARVNLNSVEWTRTLGLGFDRVSSLDQSGDLLYVGTKRNAGSDAGQPLCAHYLQTLDPIAETLGAAANVPGTFISYNADTDVLVLRDVQWDSFSYLQNALQSVDWAGEESVIPIDDIQLPEAVGELFPAADNLYYARYLEGFGVGQVTVGDDGALAGGEGVTITDTYGQLLGVSGDNVYVTIGGQAVARYDFSATPELGDLIQVMGYPQTMRVGTDQVYLPLGYFGLVTLPN